LNRLGFVQERNMSYSSCVPAICWQPEPAQAADTQMRRFADQIGLRDASYPALHRYSIAALDDFWAEFWRFAQPIDSGYDRVRTPMGENHMLGTRFFEGATLNFAENMLAGDPNDIAVIETDETGVGREITLTELRRRVAAAQTALRALGVEKNDRVAGLMPNTADALVMLLASAAIGAIWSACAAEFGVAGVLDRFGQIEPKVLVTVSRYRYNGKWHAMGERVGAIAKALELSAILVTDDAPSNAANVEVSRLSELGVTVRDIPDYAALEFNHPLYIIYTSGTTGLPKCIVHSAGGILLNHMKELMLHCDVRPGDRMLYYTSTAWMMYHWSISARACGATLVLYDGAAIPKGKDGTPDVAHLWHLVAATRTTHFGTSPKYLTLMGQADYAPGEAEDLSALRMIMTAGAPLTADLFAWVYAHVKSDLCLASISGGTEILGCFVMGNPAGALHAGEIQVPALGMAMAAVDDRGIPVFGRPGELVCTEPFPSMPLGFWGDGGWQRYVETYFGERADIWTHGDIAEMRVSGGVVISGRSDTLLKPGGVRMGPSELYRVVEAMAGIEDSLVIGYPTGGGDMALWLFVVPTTGMYLDDPLPQSIRERLKYEASPRHVPARILAVHEIPYTLNGKKVEKAVLRLLTGQPVKNRGSLANPDCLDEFVQVAEGNT
jgi:acetoacetyl-CoA synthetase